MKRVGAADRGGSPAVQRPRVYWCLLSVDHLGCNPGGHPKVPVSRT